MFTSAWTLRQAVVSSQPHKLHGDKAQLAKTDSAVIILVVVSCSSNRPASTTESKPQSNAGQQKQTRPKYGVDCGHSRRTFYDSRVRSVRVEITAERLTNPTPFRAEPTRLFDVPHVITAFRQRALNKRKEAYPTLQHGNNQFFLSESTSERTSLLHMFRFSLSTVENSLCIYNPIHPGGYIDANERLNNRQVMA
jgi:hypothetical protein